MPLKYDKRLPRGKYRYVYGDAYYGAGPAPLPPRTVSTLAVTGVNLAVKPVKYVVSTAGNLLGWAGNQLYKLSNKV